MSSERDDMLLGFERKLARIGGKVSAEDASSLIAEEFLEFGASGKVWSKAEIIVAMAQWTPNDATIENFAARELSPSVCLVTYKLVAAGSSKEISNRSSIWRYTGQKWEMIFHQGTIVQS